MASRRELEALIVLSGRISPTLQNALRQTQRGIGGVGSSSNLMGKAMNKSFELVAKAAAIGAAAVGAGLVYIGSKGIKLASDLTEVQNVVDTTFGKNSKIIDAWSVTTLKSFGLSELSAKQYSSTMGAMLKSSGLSAESTLTMSKNLTALSGDFSSFYNKNPEDMFAAIRSGISGETEPLKQLGINMSVANLEAYALSKGIKTSYSKMDQASQTTLRYNYLLGVSKDAQGDFAKTSGSLSNQVKLSKEAFGQFSAKIMSAAIPGLTKLVEYGNKLLDGAMGNPEFIKKFQDILSSGMDKVIELIPKAINWFEQLGPKINMLYGIAKNVFDFIYNNWPLIEPVIWGIVAAQLAFNASAKAALIIEALTKAYQVARTMMVMYQSGASLATIAQWALNAAMTANPIGIIIVAIGLLVAAGVLLYKNWDTVKQVLSNVWVGIKDTFATGANWVIDKVNKLTRALNLIPGVNIPVMASFETSTMKAQTIRQGRGSVPEFATGGFTNQPSIFGEAGPEAAIPLKYKNPRSLSILNKTAKAIGADGDKGRGQIQLIYSPTITGGSNSEIAAKLKSQAEEFKAWFEEYLAEQGRLSFE